MKNRRLLWVLAAACCVHSGAASGLDAAHDAIPSTGIGQINSNNPNPIDGLNINAFVGADRFYNNGITGQNAIVANVEAGHIWSGHETLGHVTDFQNSSAAFGTTTNDLFDRHATQVGHMIGGRNGGSFPGDFQLGIAYGADLRSGAIATGWNGSAYALSFGLSTSSLEQPYNAFFGTADVINSSWGATGGTTPGGTDLIADIIDGFASQNTRTTFVTSAGNSGSSPNTVGSPGSGYNGITVGALTNGGDNSYDSIASFSSRGPQDYADPVNGTQSGVRAAVDIVAPGSSLVGAFYGGQTGGNNTGLAGSVNIPGSNLYDTSISGTSFSAPIVAGGATLLNSYAKTNSGFATAGLNEAQDARVIKAVLQNSADKSLAGWDNGQSLNGSNQVVTTQSLDWALGAGAMDLDQAFTQYVEGETGVSGTASGDQGTVGEVGWDLGGVTQNGSSLYDSYYIFDEQIEAGTNLTATLTWFRDRTYNVVTNVALDVRQANLDLYIFTTDETGTLMGDFVAVSQSDYNVVESLTFNFLSTGYYGIAVDYDGNNFGSGTSVDYGLAWATTFVPEPSSTVVMLGLIAVIGLRRERRRRAEAA